MHRWGHHSFFLLPFPLCPWLIESVQPKLTPEGIPNHLSGSASADQGIDIAYVSYDFFISVFIALYLLTVCYTLKLHVDWNLYNRDGPGRIQCLCSSSAGVPTWGLYGVAGQKGVWRTVLYNGFRFVLKSRDCPTLNTQWRRLSWA